jgi:hypothetical protein
LTSSNFHARPADADFVFGADGTVTFTPSANFNGAASFSYTITDGTSTSNSAAQCPRP